MDISFLKNKKVWIGFVGIVVLFVVMQMGGFIGGGETSPVSVVAANSQTQEEKEILRVLDDLRAVDFDVEFIDSPVFLSLEDFTVSVEEGERGRQNPFAPVVVTTVSEEEISEDE